MDVNQKQEMPKSPFGGSLMGVNGNAPALRVPHFDVSDSVQCSVYPCTDKTRQLQYNSDKITTGMFPFDARWSFNDFMPLYRLRQIVLEIWRKCSDTPADDVFFYLGGHRPDLSMVYARRRYLFIFGKKDDEATRLQCRGRLTNILVPIIAHFAAVNRLKATPFAFLLERAFFFDLLVPRSKVTEPIEDTIHASTECVLAWDKYPFYSPAECLRKALRNCGYFSPWYLPWSQSASVKQHKVLSVGRLRKMFFNNWVDVVNDPEVLIPTQYVVATPVRGEMRMFIKHPYVRGIYLSMEAFLRKGTSQQLHLVHSVLDIDDLRNVIGAPGILPVVRDFHSEGTMHIVARGRFPGTYCLVDSTGQRVVIALS